MKAEAELEIQMVEYLPLTEYSSKYRVSVSTLRRRIKAEDIQFLFEDGRYMILDEPVSTHQRTHRPSLTSDDSLVGASSNAPQARVVKEVAPGFSAGLTEATLSRASQEEPILTAANRLLTELKKAYTQILQEKEEQILNLKEEVSDLKTLVRVLESDNERMKKRSF